jgi:ESCRT-II complex subunit VPS25
MPAGDFSFPSFYSYPPYFTLQPNEESRQRQLQLWRKLVVQYCEATRTFVLNLDQEESAIFTNKSIDRNLGREGRELVCDGLVQNEQALWLPPEKAKQRCLVTRVPIRIWAQTILRVVNDRFTTKTMALVNLYSGEDVQGTELDGLPEELVLRALKALKAEGKVALFSLDDGSGAQGVKFQ